MLESERRVTVDGVKARPGLSFTPLGLKRGDLAGWLRLQLKRFCL
jgi:hypothetical protein